MSPERTHAYRRVLHTLDELGPSKLQGGEQEQIRYAADSLIFCSGLEEDEDTRGSFEDIELLLEVLVDSGRWERVTAERLVDDLRACGPRVRPLELEAAA